MALCKARISTKQLWGFSSSNPHHSQSRAEQQLFHGELNPLKKLKIACEKSYQQKCDGNMHFLTFTYVCKYVLLKTFLCEFL